MKDDTDKLEDIDQYSGQSFLEADAISVTVVDNQKRGLKQILEPTSIIVPPSAFIGVLGGSGQGKSTLVDTLSGTRKATSGEVFLDGRPIQEVIESEPGAIGIVPQSDIIHAELRVEDALGYAADLRLFHGQSKEVKRQLIDEVIQSLGLQEHKDKRIHQLSGGQRKRVSVAVELLNKPRILFLDEPTSGLDPSTEEDLMELLRQRSIQTCPVVCTTHHLASADKFSEIIFVNNAKIAYRGGFEDCPTKMGVGNITDVYKKLSEEPDFQGPLSHRDLKIPIPKNGRDSARRSPRLGSISAFSTLIRRQWSILSADKGSIITLLAQAILLGMLIGLGVENIVQRSFLLVLAAFWFGCSNAAQSIVKELPILRREHLSGLDLTPYLASKTIFWILVSGSQIFILWFSSQGFAYAINSSGAPVEGAGGLSHFAKFFEIGSDFNTYKVDQADEIFLTALALKAGGIVMACAVGVMIGVTISATSTTVLKATLLVPMIILPQIPLSGSMIPVPEMSAPLRAIAHASPCFHLKRISDASQIFGSRRPLLLNFTDSPAFVEEVSGGDSPVYEAIHTSSAWNNLITVTNSEIVHKKKPLDLKIKGAKDEDVGAALKDNSLYQIISDDRADVLLKSGEYFYPESYTRFFRFSTPFSWLAGFFILFAIISRINLKRNLL